MHQGHEASDQRRDGPCLMAACLLTLKERTLLSYLWIHAEVGDCSVHNKEKGNAQCRRRKEDRATEQHNRDDG